MLLDLTGAARKAIAVLLAATAVAGLASCRRAEESERYDLKGKVVSIDKRGSTVSIAHQAIPGYMEAMTMAFTIEDRRLLDEIQPGDGIQATLVVAGKRVRLENIIHTRETVDPSSLAKAPSAVEPRAGDHVPEFKFVNQDGKRISFSRYRGRAVVLTFIYTRCPLPDYCPLMTENFAAIQNELKSDPQTYAKSQLLSISVDPEYDTPEVLRNYAAAHEADTSHWDFGTGPKEDIRKMATWFGMQYWPDEDQIVHSLRTAIIDAEGNLVKLYRGNEWHPVEIAAELRYLAMPDPSASNPAIHR